MSIVAMPEDTPEWMVDAWFSCISWALGEPEIRAAFEADTGHRYIAPSNAIEVAIDESTGHGKAYVKAFVAWANVNVWGSMGSEVDL